MSAAPPATPALSLAEAVGVLVGPDAAERFSPLTGEGLLAVDLSREGQGLSGERVARAAQALRHLPAPCAGLRGPDVSRAGCELLDHFDLVLEDEAALELVRVRVREHPLASLALVQLLRHTEGLDIEAGLFAESLVYSTLQAGPDFSSWLESRRKAPHPPAPPESGPPVKVSREIDRLHLRLNRPERHNAFSAAMRDALCEGLSLALLDDSIAEVVLSGEGPSFCSGGDLAEFGTLPDPATAHAIRSTRHAARLVAACGRRLRAEVHGACVGAGAELPAFAAHVAAREDARFQLPELSFGLVPGAGGTVSIPRRIGRQRAGLLALVGQPIDAETALAWGLVDELRHGGAR